MDLTAIGLSLLTEAAASQGQANAATMASVGQKLNGTPVPTGATRALGTPFMVDPVYPALVIYSMSLTVTAGLLSPSSAMVQLLCDTNNPPLTVLGSVSQYANGLGGLALQFQTQSTQQLVGWVPGGAYVELVATTSGTTVLSVSSATELVFSH